MVGPDELDFYEVEDLADTEDIPTEVIPTIYKVHSTIRAGKAFRERMYALPTIIGAGDSTRIFLATYYILETDEGVIEASDLNGVAQVISTLNPRGAYSIGLLKKNITPESLLEDYELIAHPLETETIRSLDQLIETYLK